MCTYTITDVVRRNHNFVMASLILHDKKCTPDLWIFIKNDESISLSHHWCEHEMYISKNIHNYLILLFNATFNNISVISWRSVLLAEETVEPEENRLPQTDKLYHIMLYRVHFATSETRTHNCKHWVHTIRSRPRPTFNKIKSLTVIYRLVCTLLKSMRI